MWALPLKLSPQTLRCGGSCAHRGFSPFPLGRLDHTTALVTCRYLIRRGGCGTDVFLNECDRWPQKSKRRGGGYIRDGR